MFVAWTTVATREDAERLAEGAIARQLAACVQIEGPVQSVYRWKGQVEKSPEFRLTFKCLPSRLVEMQAYVLSHHPYEVPEWIVVRAEIVGEKYLSWAGSTLTNQPL